MAYAAPACCMDVRPRLLEAALTEDFRRFEGSRNPEYFSNTEYFSKEMIN